MTTTRQSLRKELLQYVSADPIIVSLLTEISAALNQSSFSASLEELQICLINPHSASAELKRSEYFTGSCQAIRDEKLIIINELFLLELEAAIRSFALSETVLGCPYLADDGQLFGLVRRIGVDPIKYLARLRSRTQLSSADTGVGLRLHQELMLVTLFFIAHEVGHFLSGHPRGQYATFVDPDTPIATRIENAVVKLCRHVDEFTPTQFQLPGFQQTENKASRVRQIAEAYRERDERLYDKQEAFFANEAEADAWANEIVLEHLTTVAESNTVEAERSLHAFVRGVFVAALYSWYKDLDLYAQKLGIAEICNMGEFSMRMAQGREQYIYAASLFGEYHRFTLLRAALAIEVIMRRRTSWFNLPAKTRSIWCDQTNQIGELDLVTQKKVWLSESLQCYFLLCISMDTAVKIANVGCSTGWLRSIDGERGAPGLLLMKYESILEAVDRLRRFR